jgi:hypothetical protein
VTTAPSVSTGTPTDSASRVGPPKSFVVTWLLSLLLGHLGVDRFYLGKVGTGLLKLVTFGALGIWWIVDLIVILTDNARSKSGARLDGYEQSKTVAVAITVAFLVVGLVVGAINGAALTS